MTTDTAKPKTRNEILDLLEAGMIAYTVGLMKQAGRTITVQEASNLIGKVGTRIAFGKDVFDSALPSK